MSHKLIFIGYLILITMFCVVYYTIFQEMKRKIAESNRRQGWSWFQRVFIVALILTLWILPSQTVDIYNKLTVSVVIAVSFLSVEITASLLWRWHKKKTK